MRIDYASILTWSRLWLMVPSLAMAFIGEKGLFLFFYILALLTDTFDGPTARWQKTASERGAQLDGIIDAITSLAGFVAILWFEPRFLHEFYIPIIIVLLATMAYAVVSWYEYAQFLSAHLWSGKVAMFFGSVLVPVTIIFGIVDWYVHITWITIALGRIDASILILRKRFSKTARWGFD